MKQICNPIIPGWYADPEARFYEGKYYIYVTRSETDYKSQLNIDAFSSSDLINWEKHESILDMSGFPYVTHALWAPTIIFHNGLYYLIFASNNVQFDGPIGGIEVTVSDSPAGPFRALIGKPLIQKLYNKAEPIDAHLFKDDDETVYLYYGGAEHCNVCRLSDDFTEIVPLRQNGELYHEIILPNYMEAPCMIKDKGIYYLMWSSGDWRDGTYSISYASSDSPIGGFTNATQILASQPPIADGPGHHGFLYFEPLQQYLIVYHRRIIGDDEPGHRVLCIDKMILGDGRIEPITMTNSWEY